MDNVITDKVERYLSERGEILRDYRLLQEKLNRILEACEKSICKVPILIETAIVAGKQSKSYGTSYGGCTYESQHLVKQEIARQLDICRKFISESVVTSSKFNELQNMLYAEDKKMLEQVEKEWKATYEGS